MRGSRAKVICMKLIVKYTNQQIKAENKRTRTQVYWKVDLVPQHWWVITFDGYLTPHSSSILLNTYMGPDLFALRVSATFEVA